VESKSASTTSPPTNLAFSAFGTARGVRTFAFSFFCDLPTDSFHSIRAVRWAQTNGSLLSAVRFLSCYIERRPNPTPLTPPSRRHPSFLEPQLAAPRASPRSKREREREGEARDIGDGGGAEVPRGRAGDAGRPRPPRRLHARVRVRESRAGREMLEEGEGAGGGPLPDRGDDPEEGGGRGGGSARDGVHRRDEVRRVLAGVGRAGEGGRRPRPQLPRGDAGHRPLRHGEDHQQPPSGTSAILIAPRWVSFVTCSALVVTKSFDR
jgi:hypothetical protein